MTVCRRLAPMFSTVLFVCVDNTIREREREREREGESACAREEESYRERVRM